MSIPHLGWYRETPGPGNYCARWRAAGPLNSRLASYDEEGDEKKEEEDNGRLAFPQRATNELERDRDREREMDRERERDRETERERERERVTARKRLRERERERERERKRGRESERAREREARLLAERHQLLDQHGRGAVNLGLVLGFRVQGLGF